MNETIANLDDKTALYVLNTIARYELSADGKEETLTPEEQTALRNEFCPAGVEGGVTDGDLARAALQVLACEPKLATRIDDLARGPKPDQMAIDFVTGVVVVTLAIAVLKTGVSFKVDSTGKWSLKIDKEALSDELMKILIEKILSRFDSLSDD